MHAGSLSSLTVTGHLNKTEPLLTVVIKPMWVCISSQNACNETWEAWAGYFTETLAKYGLKSTTTDSVWSEGQKQKNSRNNNSSRCSNSK